MEKHIAPPQASPRAAPIKNPAAPESSITISETAVLNFLASDLLTFFPFPCQFFSASVQYCAPYMSVSRKVESAFSCAMLTLVMVSSPSTVIWLPSM